MTIVCVLIPYFAAAVERRAEPTLASVPLIIGEPAPEPDRVFALSAEAARSGVKPGMSLRQAQALCPPARVISARPRQYQHRLAELLALLATFTHRVEPEQDRLAAAGYLDPGRLSRPAAIELAREIGRTVREQVGLASAIGLDSGKFPAWVAAASTGPNTVKFIAPGREAAFLAPRPITLLPLDEELARRLRLLGLHTLGHLAALPPSAILTQFGQQGRWLHQLAQGRDRRPVLPHQPQVVERATRQLEAPTDRRAVLQSAIGLMAGELAARLQARGQASQEVGLILHLADGGQEEARRVPRRPINDSERLAQILGALLDSVQVRCGVVRIEVCLTAIAPASGQQLDLFAPGDRTPQGSRLRNLLPDLLARYGPDCFYRAALTAETALLPEHRFQLWAVEGR